MSQSSLCGSHQRRNRGALAVSAALLTLFGCASSPALVGPRPKLGAVPATETVRGDACGILVFGFIPARTNSRTERAYEAALEGRSGTLTDTSIQYSWYAIPFVGLMLCTEVEGKVVPS